MKKLLNTLYINKPERFLSLDGENVVVLEDGKEVGRFPLHNIGDIVTFGYTGASPALMGECVRRNIPIVFMSSHGRFLARVTGEVRGNVTLRKEQFRRSDNDEQSALIARNMLTGKIYNAKWVLERAMRDHPMRVDTSDLSKKSAFLSQAMESIRKSTSLEVLRGLEGEAASIYFSGFDQLILQQKDDFKFSTRSKRPPLDRVNAMLSFAYTLLAGMCAAALEAVGLDPYVGFLHRDRPGRASLALDLMEELRATIADRFVLTVINTRILNANDFLVKENGAVFLQDEARKTFLTQWQSKKQDIITHPFLNEKLEWGMVPYVQAMLLARYLRGDLDEYPPFLWK